MTRDEFDQLISEALQELPAEFRGELHNIVIVTEDEPNEEQRRTLQLPRYMSLFGLFEGVPKTEPGAERAITPNRITLFQGPIERAYTDENEIKQQIKNTLFHEIGHYFGMSEEELQKYR